LIRALTWEKPLPPERADEPMTTKWVLLETIQNEAGNWLASADCIEMVNPPELVGDPHAEPGGDGVSARSPEDAASISRGAERPRVARREANPIDSCAARCENSVYGSLIWRRP
jgi:hypothetical protein